MEAAIMMVGMLVLMLLRVPVAFAMAVTATGALIINGIPLMLVPQRMFTSVDSFTLLAIPLFIFVGEVMNTGGVTQRIFSFARVFVRHITGSLGHVNVISNMIIAGMSGSAVADASAIGTIEIKVMKENGFDLDWSAALTAASSTIGPIIPPSIPLVIYAVLAEESVGRLFLGGVIPGLLMGGALMVLVYFMSKKRGYKTEPKASRREKWEATISALPSLLLPLLMFGGIVGGIVTPTEAAGIAAIYAIFLGFFVHKELTLKLLYKMLLQTAISTGTIIIIIASASVLTWVFISSNFPTMVSDALLSVSTNKYVILFLINIILLVMGCFLEGISILMIMVPILLPIVKIIGVDPVHLGVFLVLNVMIGLITPPVGLSLYVVSNVGNVPFAKVAKAIIPFMIPLVIVLFLITFIPDLVMFLPNALMGAK